MTTADSTFVYKKSLTICDKPTIRILELLPCQYRDYEVRCNLVEHTFDDTCPEYEALSYAWGDASSMTSITCNESELRITCTLHSALRSLRHSEHEAITRRLWIDQICINQKDVPEKNQQVAMMCDIYRRGSGTIAWLGEHESASLAYEAMHKVKEFMRDEMVRRIEAEEVEESGDAVQTTLADEFRSLAKDPVSGLGTSLTKQEIRAIQSLLRSSWFTRMWILQEAAVSPSLTLQSDTYTFSLDLLVLGIFSTAVYTLGDRRVTPTYGTARMLFILASVRAYFQRKDAAKMDILYLLTLCRNLQASDVRDRLYSLYGISSTNLTDKSVAADYALVPRKALADAVIHLMQQDGSLRALELVEGKDNSNEESLPSWVPKRWTQSDPELYDPSSLFRNDAHTEMAFLEAFGNEIIPEVETQLEMNLGDYEKEIRSITQDVEDRQAQTQNSDMGQIHIKDDGILCAEAQYLDQIETMSPVILTPAALETGYGSTEQPMKLDEEWETLGSDYIDEDSWLSVLRIIVDAFRLLGSQITRMMVEWEAYVHGMVEMDRMVMNEDGKQFYPSGETILDAYRKTVCAGNTVLSEDESITVFQRWRSTLQIGTAIARLKQALGLRSTAGIITLIATSLISHAKYDIDMKLQSRLAMKPLFGRRLAWTTKGYLALVPAKSKVGDSMFALRGSKLPFVLRRSGEDIMQWLVQGPTYVHGIFKVEWLDDHSYQIIEIA
ncbi:hypothetical protein LTR51_005734 [Lithohypha guttulata]|nr:hypothetical protein LTR51_005734 [Lithohypha guttulata]